MAKERKKYSQATTLKDIANATGFSINTVSHALHNKDDISKTTKDCIAKAAAELGYIGNVSASALRSGFSKTIAIIIGDISNPLFGILVREIENSLRQNGYDAFIMNTNEDETVEEQAICSALSKNVDGFIICPTQKKDTIIHFLMDEKIPFVLIGRRFPELKTNFVIWDDYRGGYLATSFLIEKGHSHIVYINAPLYISSAVDRLRGYTDALKVHNIPLRPEYVIQLTTANPNLEELEELLKSSMGMPFSAIFAFSDMIAWQAAHILNTLNRQIPEDVAIIGFDDIGSELTFPCPLTTIHTPKAAASSLAVSTLLGEINSACEDLTEEVISVSLVVRGSV